VGTKSICGIIIGNPIIFDNKQNFVKPIREGYKGILDSTEPIIDGIR
jgi:hypothetical protein